MKKHILYSLCCSLCLVVIGSTAFAAEESAGEPEIKISGKVSSIYIHHYNITNPDRPDKDGLKTTWYLNADAKITNNLNAFARVTYQYQRSQRFADYVSGYNSVAMDSWGIRNKNKGIEYSLGAQAFSLGATGVAYDNAWIGKHALPYTAMVAGKVNTTDLRVFYARTNYQSGIQDDTFYGIEASYPISNKVNIGGLIVHENAQSAGYDTTIYTFNTTYLADKKWNMTAEYLKSNRPHDNMGYILSFEYKADPKNALSLDVWRVEDQAALYDANFGSMTTQYSNAKGVQFLWRHKINQNLRFTLLSNWYKKINDDSTTDGITDHRTTLKTGFHYIF
mgnify:FL=1